MGRDSVAAKARRQAAAAAAAGQGAVAEPTVAAQPAPVPAPEQAALVAERATEENANLTQANLDEYEKHRRAAEKNERAYDKKEESIFRFQSGGTARDYKEVADAAILGRFATQTLHNAINRESGSPNAAAASAQLVESMKLLRIASNYLKNTPVRKYSMLSLDIRDARTYTRQAVNLLRQAATGMNINLRLPDLPR